MDDELFHIRVADWREDLQALRQIREAVFVIEQAVPLELEWDREDERALHLLAEDERGEPIGTARLLASGQIGRMAVVQSWRGHGVGTRLLAHLLQTARQGGYPTPFLNAQIHAQAFYTRQGFRPVGEVFEEAGIAHIRMELVSDG